MMEKLSALTVVIVFVIVVIGFVEVVKSQTLTTYLPANFLANNLTDNGFTENVTNVYGNWWASGTCSTSLANSSDHKVGAWSITCGSTGTGNFMHFNFSTVQNLAKWQKISLWVNAYNIDRWINIRFTDNSSVIANLNITYNTDYSADTWNFTTKTISAKTGNADMTKIKEISFPAYSSLFGGYMKLDGIYFEETHLVLDFLTRSLLSIIQVMIVSAVLIGVWMFKDFIFE